MFDTIPLALAVSIFLFVGYLLVRAYRPEWFGETAKPAKKEVYLASSPAPSPAVVATSEGFQGGVATPTKLNTPVPPIPAPAPVVQAEPLQAPRVVSPGGPNPPNAAPPADAPATLSPEAKPLDPYEDTNMEAPIRDSMRHPELSFGPGVDNTGMNRLATSGVASARTSASESPFSPDFAQNGGNFMGAVYANDLTKGDSYATA
jgi:hypothetical protein